MTKPSRAVARGRKQKPARPAKDSGQAFVDALFEWRAEAQELIAHATKTPPDADTVSPGLARARAVARRAVLPRMLSALRARKLRAAGVTDAQLSELERIEQELGAWASKLPTPAEYERRFLKEYVPAFNAATPYIQRCVTCGNFFGVRSGHDLRSSYCRDSCRPYRSGSLRDRAQRHWDACPRCTAGKPCSTAERLIARAGQKRTDMLQPRALKSR